MMLKLRAVGIVLFFLHLSNPAQAGSPPCTILTRDTGEIIAQNGPCDIRNSPASTFKIALALIGFDAGILTGAHAPVWSYQEDYHSWDDAAKKDTDPTSWLRESIVWYSQVLTKTLGVRRLQGYVDAFSYGNQDLSGDVDPEAVLPGAVWVNSTLQISPIEQVDFLRKLLSAELPVSKKAYAMTLAIVPTFQVSDGWLVHGKTGTGFQPTQTGAIDRDRQFGWFIGWASKGKETVIFARLIKDDERSDTRAGFRARDTLLADLPSLLPRH
jgi:beta-lactamase class D